MSDSTLVQLVRAFGEAVSGNCRDMVGSEVLFREETLGERRFAPGRAMTVMIHYTGVIQGEFAFSLDEEVAARLIGCPVEGMSLEEVKSQRGDYVGFLKEALNTSVGMAIPQLEAQFDALTFLSPVVVFGEIEYPDVPSGFVTLAGEAGEIDCFFVLNMMGLELGERLQQAIQALGASAREASAAKRSVGSMLQAFPMGLVTVDRHGIVRPGHGERTAATVGLAPDAGLAGLHLVDLLGFPPEIRRDLELWLEIMHDRLDLIPFKDLVDLCPVSERENSRGVLLRLEWVPLRDEAGTLDGLLLIVEDVTEKRRIEREMKHLARVHEESVELVTRIVNLEPDEVQDFLYDSGGLLQEAQKVVHTAKRDRRFIEQLYRSIHTLKGNSGQFQFKGLQKLANDIESEIARLRDQQEWDSTVDVAAPEVERIEQGLEEAENYIRRIEEMRTKLGRRTEGLEEKAERSSPSVLVPLSGIDTMAATVWGVREAGRTLGWSGGSLQLLGHAAASAARLREVDLARLVPTLEAAVERTATRVGKKARFSLASTGLIDVEVLRTLQRCLVHLVNNSIDHGLEAPPDRLEAGKLETGLLTLSHHREGDEILLRFSDDGRGIDPASVRRKILEKDLAPEPEVMELSDAQVFEYLFHSGFSTRDAVGELSGRGVGLDMVKTAIEDLGGRVRIETGAGKGTTFVLRLPLLTAQPSHRYLQAEGIA